MSEATILERPAADSSPRSPRPLRQHAIAQCTLLRPGTMVSGWWARAWANVAWVPNTVRAPIMVEDDEGGKIAEGRNQLVELVLSKENESIEFTHILWVDDDVLPISPKLLHALHSHREDSEIVSGVYFFKEEFSHPLIFPGRGQGVASFVPDKCFECWGVGMGLTLVSVGLYKRMRDELKLPSDSKGRIEWYRTPGRVHEMTTDENGIMNLGGTEDLYFCELAAKLGVRPVVDTGRHAFGFHLDYSTLRPGSQLTAYPLEQWNQYRLNRPMVWQTKDGPVAWR